MKRFGVWFGAICVAAAVAGLVRCGGGGAGADGSSESAGGSGEPGARPAWLLASEPAGAVDVGAARGSAEPGDRVAVRGRIGGRVEPISEGLGVFVMVDPAIPTCAELEDDHCPTPWDYCCEPKDSLNANTAAVRIMPGGELVEADLVALGLEPTDTVIVEGVVGEGSGVDVLVIDAEGVYEVTGG